MSKIGIIFWFSMALIIGCGRYEVNVPDPNTGSSTNTSTNTGTSTKKTAAPDKEDEKVTKPESVTGTTSNTPTKVSTETTVQVDVKVSVKVNTRTINGTQYTEDQQLNYYVLPQHCISLNRFDKKGRQLYSSWDGDNYVRLYTDNSCWPKSDDVAVKRDETLTVCQKNLQGGLVCNLIWLIEINPNGDREKSIREYLDNVK